MTKITKELLLEKGTPKCSNLGQIKKINLSNLNLKTSDFDRKLFSQLQTLEELDVSGNLLTEFPNNLGLTNLRLLNCANNKLEQITTLNQFKNLEDLNCEDNLYLTISDMYKVMYLLPNLRQLDGKNITSKANNLKFVNSQKLMSQVTNFWEKYCKIQFSELPTAAEISAIKKDFVKSAIAEIKYGPNSLKEFTKWRVKTIATEFVNSLLQQDKQRSSDAEENEDEEKMKANLTDVLKHSSVAMSSTRSTRPFTARDTTKSRKQVISEVSKKDTEDISRKSMKIQLGKERQSAQMAKYPNKASRVDMKTKPSTTKRDHSATPVVSKESIPRKRPKYKKTLVLEPLHFLQSHSRNNNPEDLSTQLWACAFEPEIKNSQIPGLVSSQSVATCGGDSVCIIDCETGIVSHKYKSVGEEFFSLAWTTLPVFDNQKRKFNVLAVGGKMGVVKLIHVKVSYCYGMIKAHKKAISTLYFSPKHETFLFTGSYDKTIILWDIGVPDNDYNFRVSRLLVLKVCSTPLKMSLVPTFPDQYLLAACEGGCFAWDISLTNYDSKRNIKMEFLFPVCNKENSKSDSLAFCNDDLVASKGFMQGSIYLWSWSQTLKRWNKRQTKIHAVILRELEWSNTEEVYIALSVSPVENYLFCGDEKGDIWMYDLDGVTDEEMTSGKKTPPTQILKWPAIKSQGETVEGTLINNVTTDPECNYLVAVTDQNIVVIWKRT